MTGSWLLYWTDLAYRWRNGGVRRVEEVWQGWIGSVAGRRGLRLSTWGACPTAPSSVRPARCSLRWVLAAVTDPILGPDWFLLGAAALEAKGAGGLPLTCLLRGKKDTNAASPFSP